MVPQRIIIHHSATKDSGTVSWGAIRDYHVNVRGWHAVGYHGGAELVGDHYEIFMGRLWDVKGAHIAGLNEGSLGLCVVGNWDEEDCPDAQWALALEFVRFWMRLYNIPVEDVWGHGEYANAMGGNPTACPGKYFDMDRFRAEL